MSRRVQPAAQERLMRIAAVVAAAAAAADLLVLVLLHVVSPDVDPVTRPVSEYALGDGRWLATTGTVAEGVGAMGLAIALRHKRAAGLLVVFGLIKLTMPLFPVDALGTPASATGNVHNVLGNLAFFLFPVAALVLSRALRREGNRSGFVIAAILAVATVGVLAANAVGAFGLAQRAYLMLCALWLVLAAVWVSRCPTLSLATTRLADSERIIPGTGVGEHRCQRGA
jgi:hypothetical protein